jgi:hypothetical protein
MIGPKKPYHLGSKRCISVLLNRDDPEDLSRLVDLMTGFPGYSLVENVGGRRLRVKLYPGLSSELRQ